MYHISDYCSILRTHQRHRSILFHAISLLLSYIEKLNSICHEPLCIKCNEGAH